MSSMGDAVIPTSGGRPNLDPQELLLGALESDEAVVTRILAEHKPSRNPLVRGVWIVIGSLAVVFPIQPEAVPMVAD